MVLCTAEWESGIKLCLGSHLVIGAFYKWVIWGNSVKVWELMSYVYNWLAMCCNCLYYKCKA